MKKVVTIMMIFVLMTAVGCQKENNYKKVANFKNGTNGYLWEVSDGDSKVYLLGTIHLGTKDMYPLSDTIENAFNESEKLITELGIVNENDVKHLYYTGEETIYDNVSEENIQVIKDMAKMYGIEEEFYLKYCAFNFASEIMQYNIKTTGISGEYGMESYFIKKANESGKAIEALETVEYQANIMKGLPKESNDKSILEASSKETSIENITDLLNKYLSEDEKIMENTLPQDKNSYEYQALILERNVGMTNKIKTYIENNETVFVAVGTAHMIGNDSVVKMLESQGYKVSKL